MVKKQTGIRNQIQKPLIIFIVLLLLCSAILSILLVFGVSYKVAMKRAADQTRSAATQMEKYKALPSLISYWYDHRDDLEKIYDYRQISVMEEDFRDLYPQYVLISDVTDEEFNAFYTRWQNALSKKTSSILERRQLGAIKAENDWIRGHCKGPRPENIAMLML